MAQSPATLVKKANAVVIGEGDLTSLDEFFTPNYVVQNGGRVYRGGHAVIRKALRPLQHAFPKIKVEVSILVERGTMIAWRRTMSAVQKGSYRGFPATNRRIVWNEMVTSRFDQGRIAEEWLVTDLAERLLLSRKRRAR